MCLGSMFIPGIREDPERYTGYNGNNKSKNIAIWIIYNREDFWLESNCNVLLKRINLN